MPRSKPDPAELHDIGELAARLKRLRVARGLSGRDVAAHASMSQSKLSKIETGALVPAVRDVERLLSALNASRDTRRSIIRLARSIQSSRIGASSIPTQVDVQEWISDVSETAGLHYNIATLAIAGELQTPAYAHAAFDASVALRGRRSDLMRARMRRREAALKSKATRVAIIPERALRPTFATLQTMDEQIRHLIDDATHSGWDIGVLPSDTRLPFATNEFVLFDNKTVISESIVASKFLLTDEQDAVRHFSDIALHAERAAEWGQSAIDLLEDNLRRLELVDLAEASPQ